MTYLTSLLLFSQVAFAEDDYAERTYRAYCVGCHETATEYVKEAPLDRKNEELIKVIREGQTNALGMPAYGWMISEENAGKIIEYLRELKKSGV
jgi:mono/diheme cytochrome c family protein